jgi:predicted ABC-type ATPase
MSDEKKDKAFDLHVMVFAGPNGSGKTSLIDEIKQTGLATVRGVYPLPVYFINPDQVAKDLQGDFPDQNARDEAAQRAAMRIRAEAAASKLPFAFETVMSHPSRINEMLMLKERNCRLFLTFITTDDPEKNVARVTLRYETGTTTGHYVAPDKVRERELDQLIAALEKDGHQVGDTDELNGTYKGAVLLKTTYFLAQLDEATKQAVIHDRLMLDTGRYGADNAPPIYAHRESLTIHYSPANAPHIERHGREPVIALGGAGAKRAKPKSRGR